MDQLNLLREDLEKLANPQKAKFLQRFFKTGKGEYGYGDIFIGLTVPQSRSIAQRYKDLSLENLTTLLKSKIHEERLIALFILGYRFQKGNDLEKRKIYDFYLDHTRYVNNWDLVDSSADKIVGEYLLSFVIARSEATCLSGRQAKQSISEEIAAPSSMARNDSLGILEQLAKSESIWEKRIAMIATYTFIKNGSASEALKIAEILISDTHDLIQKAVGWMLREVGKRCSEEIEEEFLKKHYKTMPRTMLRYAIERFPEEKRKRYLVGRV